MYQFQREDLDGLRLHLGGDTREHGKELEWKLCPYCNGGDHGDKWTFSVNTETGQYICQRSTCDAHGAFVQLARDFGYDLPDSSKQEYKDFSGDPFSNIDTWNATLESVTHLFKRGIPAEIVERYKITTYSGQPKILVFPFFDDKERLQCIKYRNTAFAKPKRGEKSQGAKEWFEANTRHILYGMWLCDSSGSLVVTEGQIDALSLAAAGIKNAVSVPGGAKNFRWVEDCREFVERFDEIIIFGDCEKGKITLVDGFISAFPKMKIKAVRIADYLKCKDANEILQTFQDGGDYENSYEILRQCVENAVDARRLPVRCMADVEWSYSDDMPKIKTDIASLDNTIRGFAYGQLCILTGWSGDGKSNFATQLSVNIVSKGVRTLIYSGELSNDLVTEQISYIIAGAARITEVINPDGDICRRLVDENVTKNAIREWMRDKGLYIWEDIPIKTDSTDENETAHFIQQLEYTIQALDCRFVVLDNLMTLLSVGDDKDVYQAQTNLIKKLKTIAQQLKIVIMLVAHPRKAPTSSRELTQDSISGTKDIVNLADMVLAYTRHNDDGKEAYARRLNVLKNRLKGILLEGKKGVYLCYDSKSNRICENKSGVEHDYLDGYAPPVLPEINF